MKQIAINPITRLEGHGKIEIFLDDEGNVANAYLQVPELRGFEQFCVGRRAEDMPVITSRICGVCPEAHHLAATKALDGLFGVEPPAAAKKIRELLYMAFLRHRPYHALLRSGRAGLHRWARCSAGGAQHPGRDPQGRPGHRQAGDRVPRRATSCHSDAGRPGHPSARRAARRLEQGRLRGRARGDREDRRSRTWSSPSSRSRSSTRVVLKNTAYADLIQSDVYCHETYYMGTVDENNKANFYDGKIRVVDPEGQEFLQVSRGGLLRAHRRAGRTLDVSEVSLSQEGGMEGIYRWHRQRGLLRHAALAPECLRRAGDAAGAG